MTDNLHHGVQTNAAAGGHAPQPEKPGFLADLRRRLTAVKPTRWIRFAIVSVVFFLFVIWLGNPWVALVWLLLADIYITQYIPWAWWKKTTGGTRVVMGWVDAIIYALVLVYFIFAFIGQNYKIPSSSLEKSLLVGDYLWVSKTVYGPRVPQTPLHFPLAQHTLPIVNTKSYFEHPQLSYHRLPGQRSIERGDIVVFNYPQGDTVMTAYPSQDYYMALYELSQNGVRDPRAFIAQNPARFGELTVRPVDRRENYVKRCVGLPGDMFQLRDDAIYINGKAIAEPENVEYNYIIPVKGMIDPEKWNSIGVRPEDAGTAPMTSPFDQSLFYSVPLTGAMKKTVESWPEVTGKLVKENHSGLFRTDGVYPYGAYSSWTRSDTDPFWIPKRGATLHVTLNNLPLYRRAIEVYEGNKVEVRDGRIFINDKPGDYYTFKYDYYWMMGDNRDRSLDSRYWGFVPEDHIVGSPMFVIVSFDENKKWSESGKIRTDRIFRSANPDKPKFIK